MKMAAEHTREEEELEEDTLFDQAGLLTNRIKKRSDTRSASIGGKRITPMKTLSLCLAFFSLGLGTMVIEPTLFDLQRLIGTEIHVIALVLVARAVGYILGSILGMILFERYNRQFILYLSMLAIMISLGLIPWCTSFVANFIVVTSLGIFMRILFAGGNVLCLDLWGRHSGPFLQAIHFSMGLGFFIAPLLSETILSEGLSSMPSNLPFLNLSVSPPLALPASSLQIERFHHNHNGIVMRLPRSIVNDTDPTVIDTYKLVANNSAVNESSQLTVTDFTKLEYTVAVTTEPLISVTTTAATVTAAVSNTELNSSAFMTLAPTALNYNDIEDDRNETESVLLTEINSTFANSENNSLNSENRTTINNLTIPEKTTTTTTDSSAVITHKPKPPFTDGNKLPVAKNSWGRKKEDMSEHVINKPPNPTTSSSNIVSTLPSTTKAAGKNTSSTELNNVTTTLTQNKLLTIPSTTPIDTTQDSHLSFTQIESNNFNVTAAEQEIVSNLSSRNESINNGPVESSTITILNSSSIRSSNLLIGNLKVNNTESSAITFSSPISPVDSSSNSLQITDPITTIASVVAKNSTNKISPVNNISTVTSSQITFVAPITILPPTNYSHNPPTTTVFSQVSTVETFVVKSESSEISKTNATLSGVLNGKASPDFSDPPKQSPKPVSLINHQYVTQDPDVKTSLPMKSVTPSTNYNYLDSPKLVPFEITSSKNDSTTETLGETTTYLSKTVSIQRNNYFLQNISHKKPFTFNNESEETQLFFGNFMHTVVDLGFSKLHVLYTIITLIVLLTSLVFLSFLCHNPRELRSKQEDEVKPGNQDDRFTYIMIGLMFFFYFSYTSCEVIFSQLFLGLLLESNMKVVLYKGSVLISVFWGIYACTRGISICCASSFKPVAMILMDLVCCIVSSSALSIFSTEVEILLWCNMALMAFGLASIVPSSLMWLENFIHISNKAACVFLLGSALAEFFIALLMGHPFSLPIISCIYACLIFSIASLLIFGLMWRLASWRGEKYCFSKADVKYQLTSQVDEEEDAFELSSGNSSLYLLNNGNNNTNGHLMQEHNGSAFSVRNKKPYWK